MRLSLMQVAAALGALALFAAPALGAPSGAPVRLWSVSKVQQGRGLAQVASGAQIGDELSKTVDLGPVAFNIPGSAAWDRASGHVFSSADGASYSVDAEAPLLNPFEPNSPKGGVTHLQLSDAECPGGAPCRPVRSLVRFHARAYAASAGGDFFDIGGVAYVEGHQASWWRGAVTTADSPSPLWSTDDLDFDPDTGDTRTGAGAVATLNHQRTLRIPLASIPTGELFAVHVSMDAAAVDDRGHESAAQAYIRDPQHLLSARGLIRRGRPEFKEPPLRALRAASCPAGRSPRSGSLQLSAPAYAADESQDSPMVLVTRSGGSRGSASVTLATRAGSATAGRDYRSVKTTVRFADGDSSPRLVEVPLREDSEIEPAEAFTVSLTQVQCKARTPAQRPRHDPRRRPATADPGARPGARARRDARACACAGRPHAAAAVRPRPDVRGRRSRHDAGRRSGRGARHPARRRARHRRHACDADRRRLRAHPPHRVGRA
jgi:Calx-beta domain